MWIFKLFLFFVLFFILFDKMTQSYLNPYKLIMVFGKKGSGKTTYLTKQAIKHIKKGWTVYSTVEIPGTIYIDVQDIGIYTFPANTLVLIDEVGMIWDNRNFKNFRTDVRDYFKFQRQYKNKVILFSQTFDIDLKLRNLTDEMYLLQNFARVFSIARRIDKRITISHGTEGQPSSLVDDYNFAPIFTSGALQITWIPRWVCFFRSYDPKPLPYISGERFNFTEENIKYVDNFNFWINMLTDKFDYFINEANKPKYFKKKKKEV